MIAINVAVRVLLSDLSKPAGTVDGESYRLHPSLPPSQSHSPFPRPSLPLCLPASPRIFSHRQVNRKEPPSFHLHLHLHPAKNKPKDGDTISTEPEL